MKRRGLLAGAACLAAAVCGWQATAPEGAILIRPYVQAGGLTQETIRWSARAQTPFTLRYGAGETLDRDVAVDTPYRTVIWQVLPEDGRETRAEHLYAARLTDLKPGTTYTYEVTGGGSRAGGRFVTVPERPARVTFIAYGDTRSQPDVHRRVAAQFPKHDPAFILHTGDLVSTSWHGYWKPEFFDPLAEVIRSVPLFPTLGNHDGDYRRYFSLPNNGRWYSFDYGNLHVVALECDAGPSNLPRMLEWLQQDLAATKATWKIVFYHRPSYDAGSHQSAWGRRNVLPILRRAGVDITLSAHTHTYQRLKPFYTPGENDRHPITHIVTAGGGAPLFGLMMDPALAAGTVVHHYLVFTIEGERLSAETFDLDGKKIDSFSITKRNGLPDEAYVKQAVPEGRFGELRALVQPSLRGLKLDLSLLAGKPVPLTFPVTAGQKAMTFEVRLERRAAEHCEMTPVRGQAPAGGAAQVDVAIRLKDPARYRDGKTQLPVLRLECVFEIDGQRASVFSGRLEPTLPAATQPKDAAAQE